MSDPWSDWDVVNTEGFQALSQRVEDLEASAATGFTSNSEALEKNIDSALERIADIEGQGPRGYIGGVPRMARTSKATSIMESKAILNVKDLTDDKDAWKQ